jgi:CBS domain-containing protein
MTTTISDIMRKKLETIEWTASVQQAARKMKDKNVSSLVIVESGLPQGFVSERDLVRKVCINDRISSTVTNKEIMSSPLITISSTSSPSEAADMMLQYNVRHLLVVDRDDNNTNTSNLNKPVGIITPLDFTRYQEYTDTKEKDAIEKILEYYL